MNIAITGGNGFIGSHLKSMIKNMGHNVILISRKKNQNIENSFCFEEFFLQKISVKIDCFIHLASPKQEFSNDFLLKEGITNLTSKILKALLKYDCKKFIFFSSAKVYGEPSIRQNLFSEDSKVEPITDYGKEKLKAEKLIISYAMDHDLDYLIYRLPMVYGSNKNSNIYKLLKLIKKSLPMILFCKTNYLKKSLISIENIKLYIKTNIQNTDTINKNIFNIADNESLTFSDLIHGYKNVVNSKSVIIFLPFFLLNFFVKVPKLKDIFLKLYGGFEIQTTKINNLYNIEPRDTLEQLSKENIQ